MLRDGSEILIRPIEAGDKDALLRGFEALSPESRYRRFLSPMGRLTPRLLRYLTEVDHHHHEALLAESPEEEPVGVARYIRLHDDPSKAEVAVTVVDDWQGRGVGTELLRLLAARARAEGIETFTATCLAENRDVIEILKALGVPHVGQPRAGLVDLEVELPASTGPQQPLTAALRQAAAGALRFRLPRVHFAEAEAEADHDHHHANDPAEPVQ